MEVGKSGHIASATVPIFSSGAEKFQDPPSFPFSIALKKSSSVLLRVFINLNICQALTEFWRVVTGSPTTSPIHSFNVIIEAYRQVTLRLSAFLFY